MGGGFEPPSGYASVIIIIFITAKYGRVTMTTESCENGAITLSRMNFCGYVGCV